MNIILKFLYVCLVVILYGVAFWLCIQSPVAFIFLLTYFLMRKWQKQRKIKQCTQSKM